MSTEPTQRLFWQAHFTDFTVDYFVHITYFTGPGGGQEVWSIIRPPCLLYALRFLENEETGNLKVSGLW